MSLSNTNKVVIFSEMNDHSTNHVMKWIIRQNTEVQRLNFDDPNLKVLSITHNGCKVQTTYGKVWFDKKSVVWFRRASYYSVYHHDKSLDRRKDYDKIFNFLEKREAYQSSLKWVLENCQCFCNPIFDDNLNKIEALERAQKTGLKVPKYIVSSDIQEVLTFFSPLDTIAIKNFTPYRYQEGSSIFQNYTKKVTYKELENSDEELVNLILQEYIEKKYELRIFFFKDSFFPMAIFSQQDNQTKIDFREYNSAKPNRTVPIQIPDTLELKLKELAKALGLESGSFDIIVSPSNDFYFLEVNPVGQFGMVSHPCNYNIEKFIASQLIEKKYA